MNRIVALIATLLAILAVSLLVLSSFDFVPIQEWKEGNAASAHDQWLAFAQGQGLDVHRYDDVQDINLDEPGLVIADWSDLSDQDPVLWSTWVKGGGRLLLSFSPTDHWTGPWTDDPAFADLGDREIVTRGKESAKAGSVSIDVDPRVRLKASGDVAFEAEDGKAFVLRTWGDGWVAATGDPRALYNKGLAKPGNRLLAASLVRDLKGPVWLPSPPAPPAADTEPGLGSPILAAALLLFALLVLWRASPRLGPVLETERFDRPGLTGRLLAEGQFLRRYKLLPKTTPQKEGR